MKKLIPKYQSPWTPINYKSPENSKEVRVTNKQETYKPRSKEWTYHSKYNPIYTVGDTQERTPQYKEDINPQTGRSYTVQEKDLPLSGTDPVGEFIVAGEVLSGLNPLGKILFPYTARFTSGPVRNWIASKALNDVLAKDALTGGVNKVVQNNGNILLQLASHSSQKPRQLRIEPQGNNAFRVHASTWGGLTNTEKKQLYEALYKELPENAKILFPESNPDYLATRGTVASLLRLKKDSRFTPGSTLQKLMYKDKDGSIKFFEGTSFTKNSELQPKTIFRTIGYKGGNIKDKYSTFFTTDPRYAKQYGKVQKYLIESDNFNVSREPLIGIRDPVGMDMFIYQNTRNNPNSRLIIGHDVVTDEFPYQSKGTEMLSLSPNNYTPIQVNKPKTSLAFFENLLANINKNNLKTSQYNYKNIGNKDIVSQFCNNLKIQGKTVSVDGNINNYSSRKLGENAKNNLIHNTIERNIDEMRNLGYSENEINLYRQKAIDELNNVRVGHYTAEDYSKANMGESGGFYNPDDNFISVNTESKFPVDFIEAHEGRHMLDFKTSTMPHQDILLSDAYDNDFINIPNTKYAGSIKGYQNMNRERITTNRDARETLLKGFNKESRHIQNLVIDKSPDYQIFKSVENANGYGRRYIQFLRDNNALTHQKAQQFREAMKHVGVITGISFGIANQNKQ